MRTSNIKFCFFLLPALWDGNTGRINAEVLVHTATEGGNIEVPCSFFVSGKKRIFCKEKCEGKDILIETNENSAQRGRYSIRYKKAPDLFSNSVLYVSITELTKSDSGSYRCSLERNWLLDSSTDFEIRVTDAPVSSKPEGTRGPFSTSVTPATTQSFSSTSGGFTPSSASPETTNQLEQLPSAASPGELLYVGLTLSVLIIVLSVTVLIFCRKRAGKPKEPPEESVYANVTEANGVYEEVRPSRSAPAEISIVNTCAKYTKPSLVTAASSQREAEDANNKLTYSVLGFSTGAAASLSGSPGGDADNVVYSEPRVQARSDGDASPPLYSTVTLRNM